MDYARDPARTLEVIERMRLARIGEYDRWEKIIKKIKNEKPLSPGEAEYYTRLTRIYGDSGTTNRTKIYHTRLSEHDEKPSCRVCGEESLYYCNMNDDYFCAIHVVGHDENEI